MELIRRCCVCKSVELNGRLISSEGYGKLNRKDEFTHGILSRNCYLDFYSEELGSREKAEKFLGNVLSVVKYDKCPS